MTLYLVINALTSDEVVLKSSILSWYVKKWSNIGLLTSKSANKIQPPVVLLPPATKLGQGYVFTGVCDSVHRGRVPDQVPPRTRYTPRTRYPWDQVPPRDQVHPPTRYTPPGPGTPPLGPGTPPWTRYTPRTRYTPPGPGTPPRTRYTPPGTRYTPRRTRYTPRDQVHPPRPGTPLLGPGTPPDQVHPPGTRYTPPDQGDTVYVRAVRILLECILVSQEVSCVE